MSSQPFDATLEALRRLLPTRLFKPRVGIVCGSGLSTLASSLRDTVEVPYSIIPGFGQSTVAGHKSALLFGLIGAGEGMPVVAMLGRFHPYEGHPMATVVYPIRVLARLGIQHLLITNAAGGLNPDFPVGTIVVIHDHLALPNLTGSLNALFGAVPAPGRPRFIALSDAYSHALRRLAFLAGHALQLAPGALREGTYAWVSGPTYETPAEGRWLRSAGADVVGMSTVPEVLAAREEGVQVAVLSLVTNAVVVPEQYWSVKEEVEAELAGRPIAPPALAPASHEEVLAVGRQKAEVMRSLVERIVELIPTLG